jgi:hypothetical protein
MASTIFKSFACRQQLFLNLTRPSGIQVLFVSVDLLFAFDLVATQLWSRLASTTVQQKSSTIRINTKDKV